MMSSTLGAPFGGTTRGAHHACDSEAFSLITPPNFGSGGGSCLPSIVAVALGEPGVPVFCCAKLYAGAPRINAAPIASWCKAAFLRCKFADCRFIFISSHYFLYPTIRELESFFFLTSADIGYQP